MQTPNMAGYAWGSLFLAHLSCTGCTSTRSDELDVSFLGPAHILRGQTLSSFRFCKQVLLCTAFERVLGQSALSFK